MPKFTVIIVPIKVSDMLYCVLKVTNRSGAKLTMIACVTYPV